MGMADASGISGVFEAPSGSCFVDDNSQLYISIGSGWVGINKQINVFKAENGSNFDAVVPFNDVPFDETLIANPDITVSGVWLTFNKAGIYSIMAQTVNSDVEMRLNTSNNQSSFTTERSVLRDVFEMEEGEQLRLRMRRGPSARGNVNILAGRIRILIENR